MRVISKHVGFKVLLVATVLMIIHQGLWGVIWYNDTEKSFILLEAGMAGVAEDQEKSMKTCIVDSAAFFMDSYSDYLKFLVRIERAETGEFDFSVADLILSETVGKLGYSVENYTLLIQRAESTPYDLMMVEKLLIFNYDGFSKQFNLNPFIFEDVRAYLSKGKIREMYHEALKCTESLLIKIEAVQFEILKGRMPRIAALHELNQDYAHIMLFGEYAARVFQELIKN